MRLSIRESHPVLVMKTIEKVDSKISEQILYLNQISNDFHTANSYAGKKEIQSTGQRLETTKNNISKLIKYEKKNCCH